MEASWTPVDSSILSVTPTLCELFGIDRPAQCRAPAFDLGRGGDASRLPRISKALVFAADAIGAHLVDSYTEAFEPVRAHAPIRIRTRAVMPSVTPVCFASMFTGAAPEVHGIRRYEKPILSCDTIFDALARTGRRVAIVAVRDCSIDRIFRNRVIDYFTETYDEEVRERTRLLLEEDRHDFILSYQQEYDDTMHATVPRSPESLRAMENHIRSFDALASAARQSWSGSPHAVAFVSDHGTHVDGATGRGTHGSDLADDMEVYHYWGVREG